MKRHLSGKGLVLALLFVFTSAYLYSDNERSVSKEEVFQAFDEIYDQSYWREYADSPASGYGSHPEFCSNYISFLSQFIKENNIKTVLDLGCGDWAFSHMVDWGDAQYIGIDAVQSQIEHHNATYRSITKRFYHMELSDALDLFGDGVDLIICKDVLQHLPYDYVQWMIPKFAKAKHLLITNDHPLENSDGFVHDMSAPFYVGNGHNLDISKAPFNVAVTENLYLFPEEPELNRRKTTQYVRNF